MQSASPQKSCTRSASHTAMAFPEAVGATHRLLFTAGDIILITTQQPPPLLFTYRPGTVGYSQIN